METVNQSFPGLETGLKTFINADGSVDGEIRIAGLPDEWRVPEGVPKLAEFASQMLRAVGTLAAGEEGGAYWISIGVRFGPQNETEIGDLAEMYKRHRGLFQVAAHATEASLISGLMNNVVAMESIVKALMEKRGLPPAVIFIRFTWTPDGSRPERYEGERGDGR
jgi:hypothetical protein